MRALLASAALAVLATAMAAPGPAWDTDAICIKNQQPCDILTMEQWVEDLDDGDAGNNWDDTRQPGDRVPDDNDVPLHGNPLSSTSARLWFEPKAPGTYEFEYSAWSRCSAADSPDTKTMTLNYQCNRAPTVIPEGTDDVISIEVPTLHYGTEVMLDMSGSWDSEDSLEFQWCLPGDIPHDSTDISKILRQNNNGATVYLRPDRAAVYTVHVTVSDGCNRVQKTWKVDVKDVTCCSNFPAAVAQAAIPYSNAAGAPTSYFIDLDGSASVEPDCRPSDYGFSISNGGEYKFRFSPVAPVWDGSATPKTAPYYGATPDRTSVASGCTFPGAANFAASANRDDNSCVCPATTWLWEVTEGARTTETPANGDLSVTKDQLTYWVERAATTTDAGYCFRKVVADEATGAPQGPLDLREQFEWLVPEGGLLPVQPSTSFDGAFTYAVTQASERQYRAWWDSETVTGEDKYSCRVAIESQEDMTTRAELETGDDYGIKDCLGDYSFALKMSVDGRREETCTPTMDAFAISVMCDQPPYVSVLCDQWVMSQGDHVPPVAIDARRSREPQQPVRDFIEFNFTATDSGDTTIAGLYFPGVDGDGGATPWNPDLPNTLVPDASVSRDTSNTNNVTGTLTVFRGGSYDVTLTGNDFCNPPVTDTTTIEVQCLDLAVTPTMDVGDVTGGIPGTREYTVNVDTSSSQEGASITLYTSGTYTGDDSHVNMAWRVVDRTVTGSVRGYRFPTTGNTVAVTDGGDGSTTNTKSFECLVPSGFDVLEGPSSGLGSYSDISATLRAAGTYKLSASLLDTCQVVTSETFTVTVTCSEDATITGFTDDADAEQTLKWYKGAFYAFSDAGEADSEPGAQLPVPEGSYVNAKWFLTTAPSTSVYFDRRYQASAAPVTCDVGSSWEIGHILEPLSQCSIPDSPYSLCDGSGGNPAYAHGSDDQPAERLVVDMKDTSGWKFAVQVDNQCSYAETEYTVKADCNSPPTWETDTASDHGYNMASPFVSTSTSQATAAVYWDCARQRFGTSVLRAVASPGSDTESAEDSLFYQFEWQSTPNANSWYSVTGVDYEVTWRARITAETANPFDDSAYDALLASIRTQLPNAVAETAVADGDTMAGAFEASRVTVWPNNDPTKPDGVEYKRIDCFDFEWGQVLEFTVRFTVDPPSWFQPMVADSYSTGFATYVDQTGVGKDMRPYSEWKKAMTNALDLNDSEEPCPLCKSALAGIPVYMGSDGAMPASTYVKPTATITEHKVSSGDPFGDPIAILGGDSSDDVKNWKPVMAALIPDTDTSFNLRAQVNDGCPGGQAASSYRYSIGVTAPGCSVGTTDARKLETQIGLEGAKADYDSGTETSAFTDIAWTGAAVDKQFGDSVTLTMKVDDASPKRPEDVSVAETGNSPSSNAIVEFSSAEHSPTGAFIELLWSSTDIGSDLSIGWQEGTADAKFFAVLAGGGLGTAQKIALPTAVGSANGKFVGKFVGMSSDSSASVTVSDIKHFDATAGGYTAVCPMSYVIEGESSTSLSTYAGATAANLGGVFRYDLSDVEVDLNAGNREIDVTASVRVSETTPYWESTTCSVVAEPTVEYSTTCPDMQLGVDHTTVNVAFEGLNYERASFSATWNTDAYKTDDDSFESDIEFSFEVTGAPDGSVFNRDRLISDVIRELVPDYSDVWIELQDDFEEYDSGEDPALTHVVTTPASGDSPRVQTTTTYAGNLTVYAKTWVKTDDVHVWLKASTYQQATPDDTNGGDQLDAFQASRKAATCFQPDIEGTYTVSVTADDKCVRSGTGAPPSKQVTVRASTCDGPSLRVSASESPMAGQRVTVTGSTDGAPPQMFWWTIEAPPLPSIVNGAGGLTATPVTLMNDGSMSPSFVPPISGTYTVTLHAANGCKLSSQSVTVNVGCPNPSPADLMTQVATAGPSNRWSGLYHADSLDVFGDPDNEFEVELLGQARCDTIATSITFKQHTCPATFTIPADIRVAPVESTDAAVTTPAYGPFEGGTAIQFRIEGLPATVENSAGVNANDRVITARLHRDTGVTVGSNDVDLEDCVVLEKSTATTGALVQCWTEGTSSSGQHSARYQLAVTVMGVGSHEVLSGLYFWYMTPTVESVDTAPTSGMVEVTIRGPNVGFGPTNDGQRFYQDRFTKISIMGQPCVNPHSDARDEVTCTVMPGVGEHLPVRVSIALDSSYDYRRPIPDDDDVDWYAGGFTYEDGTDYYVFSYAAPVITSFSGTAGGPATGGQIAVANVANLGPAELQQTTSAYDMSQSFAYTVGVKVGDMDVAAPRMGNNLRMEVAGTADDGSVSSVRFVVPPATCSDSSAIPIMLSRGGSYGESTDGGNVWTYDAPVITCVSQPVVDSSVSACPRITVDGENLIGTGEEANPTTKVHIVDVDGNEHVCGDVRVTRSFRQFSCRLPPGARPGDKVKVTTCRNVAVDNGPTLPNSQAYGSCGSQWLVGDGAAYSVDVNPPLTPRDNTTTGGDGGYTIDPATGQVITNGGGTNTPTVALSWEDRPVSNQTFAGIMITILLLGVIAAPLLWCVQGAMSRGSCCGRKPSGARGTAGVQIPDWQRNPAGGRTGGTATRGNSVRRAAADGL